VGFFLWVADPRPYSRTLSQTGPFDAHLKPRGARELQPSQKEKTESSVIEHLLTSGNHPCALAGVLCGLQSLL
jgi:hypothetical protein